MPNIDSIQPVYYDSLYPYYVYYDNLPLKNIVARQELINSAVENQRQVLTDAIGNQGTLSNRLNRSLEEDGSLKQSAVDDAWHNIAYHTDGYYDDGISVIEYVRMTGSERAKLSLVADDATSLAIQVQTPSTIVLFENETIELIASDSITWDVTAPNQIQANVTFASTSLHNHYYDQVPVHDNILSPDYQTYKVNALASAYKEGSLRVFINGIRLSADTTDEPYYVYIPSADGPGETWNLMAFTPDAENGTFTLNRAITASDVIRIDYDIQLI